ENVGGPGWRKDNPPIARICRVRITILQAQADERVLARKDRLVGIGNAHATGLRLVSVAATCEYTLAAPERLLLPRDLPCVARRALAFALQRLADRRELLERRLVDAGKAQIQALQRGDDHRADDDTGKPFVVGRHHEPRRLLRRGMPDHFLVGRLIARPQLALGNIGHRELPVLGGLVEAVEKALALLLLRDIEEELQDHGALARQIALDRGNVGEALLPDVLGHQLRRDFLLEKQLAMHAHDQAFFVIGAVEYADAPALRQLDHGAPHEVVIELERRRLLERGDLAALWIDAVENVFDRAVLAGSIHGLEDQQQRPAVLRIELLLKIAQAFAVGIEDFLALVLVEAAFLGGLVRPQVKAGRAVDPERRDEAIELGGERFRGLLAHGKFPDLKRFPWRRRGGTAST